MPSDEGPDSGDENDVQPIPEELQDISTEELVEADYEAVPPTVTEDDEDDRRRHRDVAAFNPPGQTRYDDSINASSEGPGGDAHEDAYSTGYDSPMATRIGDEDDSDDEAERLRELHDGRHHSDGDLSTRRSQWAKRILRPSLDRRTMHISVSWHTLLDELKACIGKLTEFKSGASFHTRAGGEP